MLRILIGCVLAAMLFSSCGYYEQRERQTLYSQVRSTNDSLDRMTREWHGLLDKALITKDFSPLNASRVQLAQFLSRRRSTIANLELPADAETLRGSEQVFLTQQVAMVTDVYPKFEQFNDLTPDSTVHNQYYLVNKDLETEIAWDLTIKKSLEAFAVRNQIKNRR